MSCTRTDVIDEMRRIGRPMSSANIALHMGRSPICVQNILNKLFAYGIIDRRKAIDEGCRRVFWYFLKPEQQS